jgi:superfamily II DNA or RNA helicase
MTPFTGYESCALPKTFNIFAETDSMIVVPKYFGLKHFGVPGRVSIPPGKDVTNVGFVGTLRSSEQEAPVTAFLNAAFSLLHMGGIISLPCGAGKTVVALKIISVLRKKTLIVVHKEFLLSQWRSRISQFMPDASVGLIKAGVIDVDSHDIVIASLQSLSMKTYDYNKTFHDFGFVIVDECHRVGTEVFSRALGKINFRYSLGLSATVERKDGMTKAIVYHLGGVISDEISLSGSSAVISNRVQVIISRFNSVDPRYARDETMFRMVHVAATNSRERKKSPNLSRMINNICEFEPRTTFIADTIRKVLGNEKNRRVLVLSDRKAQLLSLSNNLILSGLDVGFYWGGMKPSELKASEDKQVICATFSYASEGMDIPGLDTLVLASPKTDIEQSCGRILRRLNETPPLIIDVVDSFSYVFKGQAKKRVDFYKKKNFSIIK